MKKRCVDGGRLRKMKKMKITERISESAYTFLKFMMVWTLVLLADFILEFRLEYLWPCWLFFGSVYTTFHCHGLVICVVFVCAAFTLDIFCLIFVPLHWLFFGASTYVLFNYIWHTEKGMCISTVSLWVLLVYTEASLRLKDLKNSHANNLSHLFAAHCIGYPVVYLGFDATCYFTNVFRLRTQKAVQNDNDFHMHLLQHSLPPVLQLNTTSSRWKSRAESSSEYQCTNGTVVVQEDSAHTMLECLQIHSQDRAAAAATTTTTDSSSRAAPPPDSNNRRTSSSSSSSSAKPAGGASESREHPHLPHPPPHHHHHPPHSGAGGTPPESSSTGTPEKQESPPQEEQAGRGGVVRATKSPPSPKARRSNGTGAPSPPCTTAGRTDKQQRAADRTAAAAQQQHHHAEQISKLDQELRRLKAELQSSRQSEQELRSHMNNLTNSERSLRPELSLLRQSNTLLQNKILCLSKSKQKDKQTSAMLEKKTRAETEARLSVERQLTELQQHKQDEAASSARSLANRQEHSETLMLRKRVKDLETEYKQLQLDCQVKEGRVLDLESDVEALEKYRCVEQETDMLLSTLSALQEKAQHLEYNLSAETRIKLDLFSALGDTRRQLEIEQGKVVRQDREIVEMKKKIADVMAVTPGMSYMTPQPHVPQYLTKLLNSERYMLNPRALMYQCLKK